MIRQEWRNLALCLVGKFNCPHKQFTFFFLKKSSRWARVIQISLPQHASQFPNCTGTKNLTEGIRKKASSLLRGLAKSLTRWLVYRNYMALRGLQNHWQITCIFLFTLFTRKIQTKNYRDYTETFSFKLFKQRIFIWLF